MSDGRLTVVIAGNVYLSADGVRSFLEGSGYDVAALVSTTPELETALGTLHPDAAIVGDELVRGDALAGLRRISPDTRFVVVGSGGTAPAGPPDGPDASVARGAPLAAFAGALATLLVEPRPAAASAATAGGPRPGAERFRVLQFVAAVALAFGLGGLVLLYSGGTRPVGGTLALPGTQTPGTPTPGSSTPGATPGAVALQQARSSLTRLVQAIQAERFDAALTEAQNLVIQRDQARQGGAAVNAFDTEVLSSLQPVVALIPADVLPTFQSVLGGLMPPVGAQIQISGSGAFGQVQVGTTADARSVVIANAGDGQLQLLNVQIAGDGATAFAAADGCGGRSLPPGGSCTIQVSFSPITPGDVVASLIVQDQEGASVALPLSGTGVVVPPADTEAPVIVCAQPTEGWAGADVAITCTAQDRGSGLRVAGDASFSLTTNVPAGTEDANAFTGTRTVCDREGNCAQAGPIGGIQVDERAPEVSCDRPDRAWRSANASVDCRSRDQGSGLASASAEDFALSTSVGPDAEVDDAQTGSRRVCDAVGNCVTAGPFGGFKIDRRAPRVTCDQADNAWHANDVRIGCSATDGGSGVQPGSDASFPLSTNVPAGTADADAATGTARVCDAVGNCVTAGPVRGFRIDKAAPRIQLSGLASGVTYLLNETVSVGAPVQCSDEGSGVASCSAPDRVDTGAVGTFSFTATAKDEVGNTATVSVNYSVTFAVQLTSDKKNKVELRLVDANGVNVSSSSIDVIAVDLDGDPLGRRFTYDRHDEEYALTIPGNVPEGTHVLHVTATGDPVTHSVQFTED